MRALLIAGLCAGLLLVGGCSQRDFTDLDAFMAEKRARPGGIIAPIPSFKAYEAFDRKAEVEAAKLEIN